jgi:type IV pilus assembly protein PilX
MTPILHKAQRGVVLFIALIVLMAMTLAGIALMRNVDSGTVIAGNLAFRQTATHVADIGVEAARAWLTTTSTSLYGDSSSNGYYATWQESIDLLGNDPGKTDFNWASNSITTTGAHAGPTGYTVRYVIHRLCQNTGDPTGSSANCVKTSVTSSSTSTGTKGAAAYGSYAITVPTAALYRITVRVEGPRNTLGYIQSTLF